MNTGNILKTWIKKIAFITALGLLTTTTTFAHPYYPHPHWHHHGHWGHGGFNNGLLIGGVVGLIAGAGAAAMAENQNDYGPYYPDEGSCRQVFLQCYIHYGYYGPQRVCYHQVRWVC